MNLIAIETSASALGVAVATADGVVASLVADAKRRHVELLQPAIESVLSLAGIERDALQGVVVDTGPGLFTGLRAGVACAKGLSLGLDIPAIGIRSTACLRSAAEIFEGAVVAALDVRRGEVAFEAPGDDAASIGTLDAVVEIVDELAAEGPVLCVGNGFDPTRSDLAARLGSSVRLAGEGYMEPSVHSLARLGGRALERGEGRASGALEVAYLREADVAITWTTRSTEAR